MSKTKNHIRLLVAAVLLVIILLRLCGPGKRGDVFTFRFLAGSDIVFDPAADNDEELARLCDWVEQHREMINSREMVLYVDGYCTSGENRAGNLAIAQMRSDRIKSELITRMGLTEECFVTRNHAGKGDFVTVRISPPRKNWFQSHSERDRQRGAGGNDQFGSPDGSAADSTGNLAQGALPIAEGEGDACDTTRHDTAVEACDSISVEIRDSIVVETIDGAVADSLGNVAAETRDSLAAEILGNVADIRDSLAADALGNAVTAARDSLAADNRGNVADIRDSLAADALGNAVAEARDSLTVDTRNAANATRDNDKTTRDNTMAGTRDSVAVNTRDSVAVNTRDNVAVNTRDNVAADTLYNNYNFYDLSAQSGLAPQPAGADTLDLRVRNELNWPIALKTNFLAYGALMPNIEIEWLFTDRWSVAFEAQGAWYAWNNPRKVYRIATWTPEVRFWALERSRWHGMYVGIFGGAGIYDLFKDRKGHQGDGFMTGLSAGYMWPIGRHWSLEAGTGVGYLRIRDKVYTPLDGHYLYQLTKNINYFGPLRLKLSLVWRFQSEKNQSVK